MTSLKSLSLSWSEEHFRLLDQTLLPHEEKWLEIENLDQILEAIIQLRVRGAPLIGVAASLALATFALKGHEEEKLEEAWYKLRAARPTAVNLMNNLDSLKPHLGHKEHFIAEAIRLFREDVELCERIAQRGQEYIVDGDQVLTHCNTGGLATAGIGTALGILVKAHQLGKRLHVYVDETRPLWQGARLTAYELKKHDIPYTLITDSMAAFLMQQGKITKAIVGADRIAKNGDFANKIGTYSVAVNCHYHKIPFLVAAPYTTVDLECPNGDAIHIEERKAQEVIGKMAPLDAPVYNPAFDVTPAKLVTAHILDRSFN